MVEQFRLRPNISLKDGTLIRKHIRDRCDVCWVPTCWELKDPKDHGRMYLPRKWISDEPVKTRGRYVQIRQLLFQSIFQEPAPLMRQIRMRCGNNRCINPAHYSVTGWQPPWSIMHRMIDELGWITEEQATKWYFGKEQATTSEVATEEA